MIYRIKRDRDYENFARIVFEGDISVEVREAMIANGITFYGYGGCWSAVGKTDDEIHGIISEASKNVKDRKPMSKEEEKALEAEYMVWIMKGEKERWRKYYKDHIGVLVRLTDGSIYNIEKPSIETRFCFGESGYDMDDAIRMADVARKSEAYFKSENLKKFREMINILARKEVDGYRSDRYLVWVGPSYDPVYGKDKIVSIHCGHPINWDGISEIKGVSEEDRERLLEGYRKAYAKFEKRLDAYLKRYGLSKIHSWTYWRDA